MDTARGIDGRTDYNDAAGESAVNDAALHVGTDERRMHVRAYNHWVSLLNGQPYPVIGDLHPENIADFGPNSVLLDFTAGIENPAIQFLGSRLRAECGVDDTITHVDQVPSRSLLSRLTDHYLQIIANRAPIGFEAEFVGQRGHNTMYRGILMPFSSTSETIDFIYGVINWKELVDAETQAKIDAELKAARAAPTRAPVAAPIWADGPGAGSENLPVAPRHEPEVARQMPIDAGLADHLMLARETAASVRAADTRSRAALYRALGRAYDFACAAEQEPEAYARLLSESKLKVQERAPMTPVVKLVFGTDYDKARVTEFAAALDHARRHQVAPGGFGEFIDSAEGGLKGLVKAERAARRPAKAPDRYEAAAGQLRTRAPIASVPVGGGSGDSEFVLLVARRDGAGALDVVARLDDDEAFTRRAVSRAAG